jgi:hypothetical protein
MQEQNATEIYLLKVQMTWAILNKENWLRFGFGRTMKKTCPWIATIIMQVPWFGLRA